MATRNGFRPKPSGKHAAGRRKPKQKVNSGKAEYQEVIYAIRDWGNRRLLENDPRNSINRGNKNDLYYFAKFAKLLEDRGINIEPPNTDDDN